MIFLSIILGVFDAGSWYQVTPEFQERIVKCMALRHTGTPQELSNVLLFLASEESSYVISDAIEVSDGAGLFTF